MTDYIQVGKKYFDKDKVCSNFKVTEMTDKDISFVYDYRISKMIGNYNYILHGMVQMCATTTIGLHLSKVDDEVDDENTQHMTKTRKKNSSRIV